MAKVFSAHINNYLFGEIYTYKISRTNNNFYIFWEYMYVFENKHTFENCVDQQSVFLFLTIMGVTIFLKSLQSHWEKFASFATLR